VVRGVQVREGVAGRVRGEALQFICKSWKRHWSL